MPLDGDLSSYVQSHVQASRTVWSGQGSRPWLFKGYHHYRHGHYPHQWSCRGIHDRSREAPFASISVSTYLVIPRRMVEQIWHESLAMYPDVICIQSLKRYDAAKLSGIYPYADDASKNYMIGHKLIQVYDTNSHLWGRFCLRLHAHLTRSLVGEHSKSLLANLAGE